MQSSSLWILIAAGLAGSPGMSSLTVQPCEFGVVQPLQTVSCQVPVRNASAQPWTLHAAPEASGRGVRVAGLPLTVPPGQTRVLDLTWDAGTALGRQYVHVRLDARAPDSSASEHVTLRGQGFVYSILNAPVAALDFGTQQAGREIGKTLHFASDDVPGFHVRQVLSAPAFVTPKLSEDGHELFVTLAANAPAGTHRGQILLATSAALEPRIRVPVRVDIQAADSIAATERPPDLSRSRDSRGRRQADDAGQAGSGTAQGRLRPPHNNSAFAPPTRPPDPPGTGPVLRWSVANEQTLYGYLIYRAEHENGPWQRVNERIIPVLGHDDAPSDYAWRDTSAVKGKTYWYFIKTLANNGSKQKLTEAHKVVAH